MVMWSMRVVPGEPSPKHTKAYDPAEPSAWHSRFQGVRVTNGNYSRVIILYRSIQTNNLCSRLMCVWCNWKTCQENKLCMQSKQGMFSLLMLSESTAPKMWTGSIRINHAITSHPGQLVAGGESTIEILHDFHNDWNRFNYDEVCWILRFTSVN